MIRFPRPTLYMAIAAFLALQGCDEETAVTLSLDSYAFLLEDNSGIGDDRTGKANATGDTVTVYIPHFIPVTALVASFGIPEGASAYVDGTKQNTGGTANDFTGPVGYTINSGLYAVDLAGIDHGGKIQCRCSISGKVKSTTITGGLVGENTDRGKTPISWAGLYMARTGKNGYGNHAVATGRREEHPRHDHRQQLCHGRNDREPRPPFKKKKTSADKEKPHLNLRSYRFMGINNNRISQQFNSTS